MNYEDYFSNPRNEYEIDLAKRFTREPEETAGGDKK